MHLLRVDCPNPVTSVRFLGALLLAALSDAAAGDNGLNGLRSHDFLTWTDGDTGDRHSGVD